MELREQVLPVVDRKSAPRIYPISTAEFIESQEEARRALEWARRQEAPELDCQIAQALAMAECLYTLLPPGWTPPIGFSY